MYGNVNFGGLGAEALAVQVPRKYNKVIGGAAALNTISRGTVVVHDFGERGAAQIGGVTRAAAAGVPHYLADHSADDAFANVTTCDNNTPQAKHKSAVYEGAQPLAALATGQFTIQGRTKAWVTGDLSDGTDQAIAAGNRLTVSKTLAGHYCFASANEPVHAIAHEAVAGSIAALIEVTVLPQPIAFSVDGAG